MADTYGFTSRFLTFGQLTKRNMKLYFKDGMTVFFSFFSPLIILLLYVLFLGRVQVDGVKAALPEGFGVTDQAVKAFVDGWLLAGVMSVSCITVAVNTTTIMVSDKQNKIWFDFSAAPLKKSVMVLSYFFAGLFSTLMIAFAVLAAGLIYLTAVGSFFLSFANVAELVGITVLSSFSSTMFMLLIAGFIKTEAAMGALAGIISAMVGFVIGAYMPISTFPKGIQYFAGLIPGSYSAGLYRNLFMSGALEKLTAGMSGEVFSELAAVYSFELDFFGANIGKGMMYILLAASVPFFLAANLLRFRFTAKNKG